MTTGEKLQYYRVLYDYSQLDIADILGVSLETIMNYESDIEQPSADDLLILARTYNIMVDNFFPGSIKKKRHEPVIVKEYKSKRTFLGRPLVHINLGNKTKARGIIAIGMEARGVIAIGLVARGLLSFGVLSIGLLSIGSFSLGLLALGAISLGGISLGGVAFGLLSLGGVSFGLFSFGGAAMGKYLAVGYHAHGMIAIGKQYAEGSLYQALSGTDSYIYDPILVYKLLLENTPNWIRSILLWIESII